MIYNQPSYVLNFFTIQKCEKQMEAFNVVSFKWNILRALDCFKLTRAFMHMNIYQFHNGLSSFTVRNHFLALQW